MRKTLYLTTIIAVTVINIAKSQETTTIEKQIYGIQAGIMGAWIHGEYKIAPPYFNKNRNRIQLRL